MVSIIFCNFVSRYRLWMSHINNPNYSPFKTCKVMNKTVRTILQVISYVIAAILGAAGEAML